MSQLYQKYSEGVEWSYEKPELWPNECKKQRFKDKKLKSPIIINDSVFDYLIKTKTIDDSKITDDNSKGWSIQLNIDNLVV